MDIKVFQQIIVDYTGKRVGHQGISENCYRLYWKMRWTSRYSRKVVYIILENEVDITVFQQDIVDDTERLPG